MSLAHRLLPAALAVPAALLAQAPTPAGSATRVGPPSGTVIVVGGGAMGPEIYRQFIDAAGGPDALIIDVPTAGGAATYNQNAPGVRGWKQAGARNVYVLHTTDRKLADSDSLAAIIARAGGVWFEGGRQFHLVDSYGGTRSEQAFHDVLARGGVVGGSSAGASILGDFLIRGAPSSNNGIMAYPGYEKGFGFLRNVGIDQHVVARERLPDLADSILPRFPRLLGISEDEGTAWVVRGDTATIIGRNKAFVYGGTDPTDPGSPFLTLHPGDRYDLGARRVLHRAADDSPVRAAFIDSLFDRYREPAAGRATVLVAMNGSVYVDESFGVPPQPRYMPTTTLPQFDLGRVSEVFMALCTQIPEPRQGRGRGRGRGRRSGAAARTTPFQTCVTRQLSTPVGMHRTTATPTGVVHSNVDELYRLALGLENPRTYAPDTTRGVRTVDYARGWMSEMHGGLSRLAAYATTDGKRAAFVRYPDRHATIIVLTDDASFDARGAVDQISDRLFAAGR